MRSIARIENNRWTVRAPMPHRRSCKPQAVSARVPSAAKGACVSMFPRKAVLRLGRYDVAIRYRPAARLGGDWYDARLGADGSAVVVVGDVAGHGLRAAAAMVRIGSALRGLCVTGLPA